MLTLRLARVGTKKRPVYHLVATNSRNPRDGRFVENLGYFIPDRDAVVLKNDRVAYWLSVGASMSEVARHLIRRCQKLGNSPLPTKATPTKFQNARPSSTSTAAAPGSAKIQTAN